METLYSMLNRSSPVVAFAVALTLLNSIIALPGAAQDFPTLLQQLLQTPAIGAATAAGGGTTTPIDAARAPAAQGQATASPLSSRAQPTTQGRSTMKLSETEMLVVRRFCEGRLKDAERDALEAVANFGALEQDYCQRAREALLQFGYETFDGARTPSVLVNGTIPDDYLLGIGDELVVTLRGQANGANRLVVDREGHITVENLPPILAAGRTFGELRNELQARVRSAYVGTEVFVSLGSVRLVAVSVLGEVSQPGVHQLTGLSTILDALAQAGGIKKTGSLRHVIVQRGGASFTIDLYDLIFYGTLTRNLALYEGDRIIVPTIGATVAVAGKVKRPGIYELASDRNSLTVGEALAMAGNTLRPQGSRISTYSFDAAGRSQVSENSSLTAPILSGTLVRVDFGGEINVGVVELVGAVRAPGIRTLGAAPSVRALIGASDNLQPDAYTPFAVLETTDPGALSRRLFPVDLQRIMSGQLDYLLSDADRLYVFTVSDIQFLSSPYVQKVIAVQPDAAGMAPEGVPIAGQLRDLTEQLNVANRKIELLAAGEDKKGIVPAQQQPSCSGLDALARVVSTTRSGRFDNAIQAAGAAARQNAQTAALVQPQERATAAQVCPRLFEQNAALLPFALEYVVALSGEVRTPGAYPVVDGAPITSVVAAAGGVTRTADLKRVEITRSTVTAGQATRANLDLSGAQAATAVVNPGDIVRFNPVFADRESGPVLLAGDFVHPGYYEIRRGETLSQLMIRAGGLTAQAYPYGAVFTRESVKRAQQEGFAKAARELSAAAVFATTKGEISAGAVGALQALTDQIAQTPAVGRVVIEADPTVLQVRPEFDTVLEPGDTVFMPKRPNSVLVLGDVLNPGALQFRSGSTADEYIKRAGGFERSADQSRLFLIFPNGSAQPISTSIWNYNPVQIPPGSAIVAPKNAAPLNLLAVTGSIAQLVSQIAITMASLAVISR